MIVLKECQQEAVNKLFEKYQDFHYDISNKEIYFQAPTGAGKTLILCTLCDQIVQYNVQYNKKCIILFVSISTGDIQEQNYDKACFYQEKNKYSYDSYLIKSPSKNNTNSKLDSIIQIPLKNHYVYFIGSSSYKDKSKLHEELILELFLDNAKKEGYEIIYIRDEAHIGTKKETSTKNLDQLLNKYANLTYYVSATLEQKKQIHVEIKMEEAINDGLVKSNLILYAGIDEDNITSKQLYEQAINKFKEVKKKYQELNYGINPCMLIQIKNTKKEDKEKEQTLIKELTTTINEHQLKYLIYTEDNKKESNTRFFNNKSNLSAKEKAIITANDSIIDVIIFKVSLATGWDIPRANMLLQLREIYSDTLDIQTIGRIRRNVLARKLKPNEDILDNYYIYSNVPKKKNDKCQTWKHNDQVVLTKDFTTIILEENDLNNSKEKELEIDDIYEGLITWFKKHNKFTDGVINKKDYHKILAYFQEEVLQNKQYEYELEIDLLFLDEEHKNKAYLVSEKIVNIFQVDDLWNKKITSYNDPSFEEFINNFVIYYAKHYNFNPYVIKLFLLDHKYKNCLSHVIDQYNNMNEKNKYKYVIGPIVKLPVKTIEYVTEQKENNKLTLKDGLLKYLYWIPDEQETKHEEEFIYSDSVGEKTFTEKMLDLFDKLTKNKNIHIMLLRNYLNNSSFKYEYIDKQPCIKKRVHYPDFIIEKNSNIYVCEIKSDNDYDAIKTEELKKAYREYSTLNDYHYLILSYINKNNFRWIHYYQGEIYQDKEISDDLISIFN